MLTMIRIRSQTGRLDHFEGGPYDNITHVLYQERIDGKENVGIEIWSSPGRTKVRLFRVGRRFSRFRRGSDGIVG